ncbi:MAG TPA: serine/threonine-protein kinase [Kofleriaceae bacterium]|nr:serine/threonine-protein kinase [Kofleriaceae bacterium]
MPSDPEPSATLSYDSPRRVEADTADIDGAAVLPRGVAVQRYVILDRVGEGGMGVVYAAYDPVLDRRVALKFLARYDADRDGLRDRRLLREAQAMARLSHPNVVVVYEVGTFQGHIFLSMEFVEGVDLRSWLSQGARTFSEIMDVFRAAGRGLAAAHAAGIIHRDFKPENVLVDGQGRPRVTDFGLSRATPEPDDKDAVAAGSEAADGLSSPSELSRPLTRTNGVVGTPSYMSPEQHLGGVVDARSDQFSLCVALYEATHRELPFRGTADERREKAIAGEIAPPPAGAAVPRWCRQALLRGLSPAPADRFPSMDALLDALKPPSARRRRWLAASALSIVLAGATGYALFANDRAHEPEPCPGAPDKAAQMWNPAARQRVRSAFLATGKPQAADVFNRVERALDGRVASWQAAHVEACRATRVRGEQSEAMLDLRMQCLERARRQIQGLVAVWQESVDLNRAAQAALTIGDLQECADTANLAAPFALPRDPAVARRVDEFRRKLDDIEARRQAGQYQSALALSRNVVAAVRPLGHPPLLAEALQENAQFEVEVGELDRGANLLREAFTVSNAAHDDGRAATVMTQLLFTIGVRAKRYAEAEGLWTFTEAASARLRDRDDLASDLLYAQGSLRHSQGHDTEAIEILERALVLGRKGYGSDDVRLARILNALSGARGKAGHPAEAETASQQALILVERWLGREHPNTSLVLENLCWEIIEADRAVPYCERALAATESIYPPGHPQISKVLHNLADARLHQERNDEARALLGRAEEIMSRAVGPDDPAMTLTRSLQAQLALKLGEVAKAHRLMAAVLPVTIKAFGEDHPWLAEELTIWGDILLRERDFSGARQAHQRALQIWRKQRTDHPDVGRSLQGLASVALAEGHHAEAIQLFEQGRDLVEKGYGPHHPSVVACMTGIGRAYRATRRPQAAVEILERAVSLIESKHVHLGEGDTRFELAQALWATGQRASAIGMAGMARDAYAHASITFQASEVDRWLRSHRVGRRRP